MVSCGPYGIDGTFRNTPSTDDAQAVINEQGVCNDDYPAGVPVPGDLRHGRGAMNGNIVMVANPFYIRPKRTKSAVIRGIDLIQF